MALRLRCALYTRKSSEEGLEQGFNSLEAQREACEAYVRSQAGEGWRVLPTRYDDGGWSGGTLERPALQRLLADIEQGLVDIVVVYKVDRLTRSLTDFARIVEAFDRKGVSFVSVTQAFNTTSSMGRLTLNVLLSFAQFEREVTGERIRDKLAASKAKGMWMGGHPPFGYDLPQDPMARALVVNEAEAEMVRTMFRRFLELCSVRRLSEDLAAQGIVTKRWVSRSGRELGGARWQEGPLRHLLCNPVYLGQIRHRGKIHPGRHPAIVEEELYRAAQQELGRLPGPRRGKRGQAPVSTLTGRIYDDRGHLMSPSSHRDGGRIRRYYVSQAKLRPARGESGSLARVPALEIEALVERELRGRVDPGKAADPLKALQRVVVSRAGAELTLDPMLLRQEALGEHTGHGPLVLRIPVALKTYGGAKTLLDETGMPLLAQAPDLALQKALARAQAWEQQLLSGERSSAADIAQAESLQPRYVEKLLRLAWMAPPLVEAVLHGARLKSLSLMELMGVNLPLDWSTQKQILQIIEI